ncbi:MAG: EAL domain-containing protein [Gemmatimonadota bacterium]|nr:EAL domain-containing protein [Gemmatimonadota bacterium]
MTAKKRTPATRSRRSPAGTDADLSSSLLDATLDATADGLLIVDLAGNIVRFNERFARMWELSPAVLASGDDDAALAEAVGKVSDPGAFLARVRHLYLHPDEESFEVIALKDGRSFERHSLPQRMGGDVVGRVWSFRDVTDRLMVEQQLRRSEERYRRLFEESREAIYMTTRDGAFVAANQAARRLFGFTTEEMPTVNTQSLYVDPADRDEFVRRIEHAGAVEDHPVRLRSLDGSEMDCLLTSSVIRDVNGMVVGYQGRVEDVTARAEAERALRASERKFRALIENATDIITVLDQSGQITYEGPSLHRVLGYSPEALLGRNVFEFVHPDDRPAALKEFERLLSVPGHVTRIEVRFLHGEGHWRVLEVTGTNLMAEPAIRGIVVNSRDVTDRKEAESQLRHSAFHDTLTGLPNRALLMDRVSQFLRRARRANAPPFAVLFLDLDRFKVVNDSLGHMTGDQLLVAAARRLEASSRPGDTVARLGGDEFTMLLDTATIEEARTVAARVQRDFDAPFRIGNQDVYVTVSIGIASSGLDYHSAEEMLRDADLAMYRAKDEGRARFEVFDTSMHAAAILRHELERDLRRAVERNELELVYQPIVSLVEGSLHGFEALIRWNHPARGQLTPHDFTPLAEDTGLIVAIGEWVLAEACRQAREWTAEFGGDAHPVHVNVSARQILRPDYTQRVRDILRESGVRPELIVMELTEGTMMANAEHTTVALHELKALDLGLSIDDFGTGYSSLSYLHRFPTDSVKIDRSFISQMGPRARDASIVRTIVDLAHDLRMKVVAEGIETDAQASALRGMRCEYGQGFLFSRAVPAAEATKLLRARAVW